MTGISYIEGDLFKLEGATGNDTILIPHVCNDSGAWGAGFVVPLGQKYPMTMNAYTAWYKGQATRHDLIVYPGGINFRLGAAQVITVQPDKGDEPRVVVCNMIAQHKTGGLRPLRYNALAACMDQVATEAKNSHENPQIRAPLFGAGLAGGNWDFIEKLIEDSWLARGLPVSIFYMRDRLPPGWTPPNKET